MRPYAIFLITLLLLHNVQVFMCRQVSSKRRPIDASASTSSAASAKRTISGAGAGQIEELQQQPGDQIESNYDEYPMIVPKRAALLLDRLMVALHHALAKENGARQRIVDLNINNNNNKYKGEKEKLVEQDMLDSNRDLEFEQGSSYNMYSDDDPSVLMDYDFKDLNSINRATGESLMTKGLQRRAQGLDMGGGIGGDDKIGSLGVARLTAAAAAAAGDDLGSSVNSIGGAGRNAVGNNGRLYWRCYFNAVSCF